MLLLNTKIKRMQRFVNIRFSDVNEKTAGNCYESFLKDFVHYISKRCVK